MVASRFHIAQARIHRRDGVLLVGRGMKGDGKSRQGFDLDGLVRLLSVSATPRGFFAARSAGGGQDQLADCSQRRAVTGLGQVCEAVRQFGGWVRCRWAIRKGVAGRAIGPRRH